MFAPTKPCFYDCLSQLKTQLLQKYIVLCALCTNTMLHICMFLLSPSPRRAWIEIRLYCDTSLLQDCRPPHGGRGLKFVASMRAEYPYESPSPRRAWIEMADSTHISSPTLRRPPHGGRGLKCHCYGITVLSEMSPSPRRAWIEILKTCAVPTVFIVALPTEGVD